MNWAKIKSIMIIFLIIINIFLVIVLGITTYRENNIPDEVTKAAAELLEKSGFPCDESIIPDMYVRTSNITAEFLSANELGEIFFGKEMAFKTDGNSLVAEEGSAKLIVEDNFFVYETGRSKSETSGRKLAALLTKKGIGMKNAVYDKKNECFYMMYKNCNLFNMYIIAEADSNGELSYVRAQWPKIYPSPIKKRISFMESLSKVPEKFSEKGEIKRIEFGYAMKAVPGGVYVFRPSWRVTAGNETQIIE